MSRQGHLHSWRTESILHVLGREKLGQCWVDMTGGTTGKVNNEIQRNTSQRKLLTLVLQAQTQVLVLISPVSFKNQLMVSAQCQVCFWGNFSWISQKRRLYKMVIIALTNYTEVCKGQILSGTHLIHKHRFSFYNVASTVQRPQDTCQFQTVNLKQPGIIWEENLNEDSLGWPVSMSVRGRLDC